MTNLSKLVAIVTAASAVGLTANAQEQFEATIEFQPGNSIEATYQDISKEVARACRKELRSQMADLRRTRSTLPRNWRDASSRSYRARAIR